MKSEVFGVSIWVMKWARSNKLCAVGEGLCVAALALNFLIGRETPGLFIVEVTGLACLGYWLSRKAQCILIQWGYSGNVRDQNWPIRFVYRGCQWGVALAAGIVAKEIVSDVMGLPATDFPVLLTVLTILSSVCFWMVGAVSLMCVVVVFAMVCGFIATIFNQLLDMLYRIVRLFLLMVHGRWSGLLSDMKIKAKKTEFIAFFIVLPSLLLPLGICGDVVDTWLHAISQPSRIRKLVYWLDYGRADKYPGVEAGSNLRLKLHDNGVVSYAVYRDGEVEIRVSRVGEGTE